MSYTKGLFIVIEGSDGSGKTTQFSLLAERLSAVGHEIEIFKFPQYSEPSSYFIQQYLDGKYGPATEVGPFTASLFYALDRYQAAPRIRKALDEGKIVLSDRFVGANMAHQGSKLGTEGEQRGFFVWEDSLEYQLLGIPRPTMTLFLRVPADMSQLLIKKRAKEQNLKIDGHEADIEHLRRTVSAYDTLCRLFPKDFRAVDCTKDGKLLPITVINERIWQMLKPILPTPSHKGRAVTVDLNKKTAPRKQPDASRFPEPADDKLKINIKDLSLAAAIVLLGSPGTSVTTSLSWPYERSNKRLPYYIPHGLPSKSADKYRAVLDKIAVLSRRMDVAVNDFAKKNRKSENLRAARAAVKKTAPLALLADVRLVIDKDGQSRFLDQISPGSLPEVLRLAKSAGGHLKERVTIGESQPLSKEIASLSKSLDHQRNTSSDPHITLTEAFPRNELELTADILYASSGLSKSEILGQLDQLSYEQKSSLLKAALAAQPESVFGKTLYKFDAILEPETLFEIAGKMKLDGLQLQPPTPRYGYEVPEILDELGLEDDYISCFDLSLELYSEIQSSNEDGTEVYGALYGHKLRCQFGLNANDLALLDNHASAELAQIVRQLRARVAEAHPLVNARIGSAKKPPMAKQPKPAAQEPTNPRRRKRSRK